MKLGDFLKGNEKFVIGGTELNLTMLDFWQFKYSNIYNLQEVIAEFLVAKALDREKADNDDYWTLWDIDYRNKRIEVKQTSYYHSFNKPGVVSKQRSFGINKTNSNYEYVNEKNCYERQNDIYVFCLNTGDTAESSNPLNLENWEFYIVPTRIINEFCGDYKTISLGRIKTMGFTPIPYEDIKLCVDLIIDEMERSEQNNKYILGLRTLENMKFKNFFSYFIQREAAKNGKVFYLDSGEGHLLETEVFEMEDVSGWLVPYNEKEAFFKDWSSRTERDNWDDYYCVALWIKKGDSLTILFDSKF